MPLNRRKQGSEGEELAAAYLEKEGLKILEQNYRFERGEIDLIAEEGGEIVFIEVKARKSKEYGDPEDSITPQKEERIRAVAEGYLFEHQIEGRPCRFDVVAIEYQNGKPTIRHIRNAF